MKSREKPPPIPHRLRSTAGSNDGRFIDDHRGVYGVEPIGAVPHTASALVITTVVLVAAFGSFAFAQFVPNGLFGIMVAFILGSPDLCVGAPLSSK